MVSLVMCGSLYVLSGRKAFDKCGTGKVYAFKNGWPVLTLPLAFFIIGSLSPIKK
ncbi:MAG: hypothetical protein IIZ57_09940 [Solobacterium sp.]|nr:hypothetical protein [Solobacterium sp.]